MNVTSKITVDMTRQNVGQRVNAVQGDGNTRLVEITLLSGGAPWTPPEGVEAAIAYMQPGGTKGLYNKLADSTAAISMAGNVATIILAPQMLTASGTVQASLVFNDAALNRLTTFPFAVSVTSNPAAGAQKVEDYLRLQWLEDKLEEYLAAIKASGVFDGKPGDNGVTFTPSVSENGDLSWRNNGGLPNPQTINIRGPQGDSTAATAAANAAQTSAANAETHAADAATSAAAAQEAVGAMGTELSQIKDDISNKLPKSPADWEQWTAEEQAVACERIGAEYLGEWEEIVTVTTEEAVSSLTVDTDKNGNPFSLTHVICEFILPIEDTAKQRSVYFGSDSVIGPANSFSRGTVNSTTTVKAEVVAYAKIISGKIYCDGAIGQLIPNKYQSDQKYGIINGYCMLSAESFNRIFIITYNDAFPAGSQLIIRGIRK